MKKIFYFFASFVFIALSVAAFALTFYAGVGGFDGILVGILSAIVATVFLAETIKH